MIPKGNKLYSILFLKCPRCHQGQFLEAHPYKITKWNHVKERCPVCDQNYKIEPSFYFGSMYVSYAIGIGLSIAIYLGSLVLGFNLSLLQVFALICVSLIVSMPYIGAVAKSIWANMFMQYDQKVVEEIKQTQK